MDGLIELFRSQPAESWRQVEIVKELEDRRDDPRVLELYVSVVADQAGYDLARIECLKILALWPPADPDTRQRVGRTVAALLWPDEDYLVRQYAAMSLGPYAGDQAVFDALAEVVRHDDDVDVRHNALSSVNDSISDAGPEDRHTALLRPLADDAELGKAATRILRDWGR